MTSGPRFASSGIQRWTGSSRESVPSSASSATTPAVTCFETDPMRNTVAGPMGTRSSRFAMP